MAKDDNMFDFAKEIFKINEYASVASDGIIAGDFDGFLDSGSYSLNALGLSTQVPMKIVLLTDGSPRVIKVGKRTIKFKKTSPKNLLAKGKISKINQGINLVNIVVGNQRFNKLV